MPLAIEITLNIFWIPLACLVSAIAGFALRSSQLHKLREQVRILERQNLQADSEILTLQKANGLLQEQLTNSTVPVIPIMTTKENPETLPDTASRKKLLGKSTANP